MHIDDYRHTLVEQGYERIGYGYYSHVYAKPGSDRCIKVAYGDNWIDFIIWGMRNGYAGTFTPRCFEYTDHGSYYVAEVERCQSDMSKCTNDMDTMMRFNIADYLSNGGDHNKNLVPVNWLGFADAFREWARTLGYADDLKPANWLLRADGSMCLNDPVHGDQASFRGAISNGEVIEAPVFSPLPWEPPSFLLREELHSPQEIIQKEIERKREPKPWFKHNLQPWQKRVIEAVGVQPHLIGDFVEHNRR